MLWRRKRVGLALGGGGARGIAHIGILRVFEAHSIPIDLLVGTSIGALVGGAFASGVETHRMEEMLEEFLESPVFQDSALNSIKEIQASKKLSLTQKIQAFFKNRYVLAQAMFRPGMLQTEDFQDMVDFFLPDIQIEDTLIPFRAVSTDLISGQAVVISRGPIRKAVMASCAVPGAVAPFAQDDLLLSDGGIVAMVPAAIARQEGAQFVVAVGVNSAIYSEDDFTSAMDVYVRANHITSFHFEEQMLKQADLVIRPRVGGLHWTEFFLAKDLVKEGERAANEKLRILRKNLPPLRRWTFLRPS